MANNCLDCSENLPKETPITKENDIQRKIPVTIVTGKNKSGYL